MQLSLLDLVKITLNDFNWHGCRVGIVLEVIWHRELLIDQITGLN